MTNRRLGLWLVGARGGVATTVCVGWAALRLGLSPEYGLTSTLSPFAHLDLATWDEMVIGGHEIRELDLVAEAGQFATSNRLFDARVLDAVADELRQINARIRPGSLAGANAAVSSLADPGWTPVDANPAAAIARLSDDLRDFCQTNRLDRVIVVNLASTEPPLAGELPESWSGLSAELDRADRPLPTSCLYAIAAFQAGAGYINFTPSAGCEPPAIAELGRQQAVCFMGRDGKTGETLLKSVLAPMFANRNLNVMSWVGHNIFGNLDGKVLDSAENKQSKVASKDQQLRQILQYQPQTLVSIEYIRSLGDWKTAWDHIHFQGFMGTPMTLQFTWQGCDSILAAPLVLDLFRFAELALRRGHVGTMPWLAGFFKSPAGVEDHNFQRQFQMLVDWAQQVGADRSQV